ncbi:MAG: CRISPR-associated endonuclease Cas3'' [Candidatus Competibacteraceae bacterium]
MDQSSTALLFYRYWGKTHGDDYHLLVYHTLDVAAVGMAWWDTCPAIRRAFAQAFHIVGSETGQLRAWVLFFLALHDLGKLDVRFQLKAPDTLQRLWPQFDLDDVDEPKGTISGFDHGASGFDWAIRECIDWFGEIENPEELGNYWRPWLAAVTGHHGDLSSCRPDFRAPEAEDEIVEHDRQARRDFINAVADLFLKREGLGLTSHAPM